MNNVLYGEESEEGSSSDSTFQTADGKPQSITENDSFNRSYEDDLSTSMVKTMYDKVVRATFSTDDSHIEQLMAILSKSKSHNY